MRREFRILEWVIHPELNRVQSGDETVHLEPKIMQVLVRLAESSGEVVIDSARQYDLLTRAAESLRVARDTASRGIPADAVAVDLQDALDAIGEITGEVASAEILDAMFGAFCVGK